jgi:protein involved in polysaccharide export with SLBB domain
VVFLTPRPVYVVENNGNTRKVTALSEGEATALASGMKDTAKVSRKGDVILIEKPKPIYVVIHNLKTNTFETKTAQTVSEAIALAGGGVVATTSDAPVTTANVHPGDILTVNIGKAPDFWEENWSKIISATAVIVGIVTTLHH